MIDNSQDLVEKAVYIEAERCIAELQRGRAIVLTDTSNTDSTHRLVRLVETFSKDDLGALIASQSCQLVISRARALALELRVDSDTVCLELAPTTNTDSIFAWAGLSPGTEAGDIDLLPSLVDDHPSNSATASATVQLKNATQTLFAKAAINLAHHAHALPAFIMHTVDSIPESLLHVDAAIAKKFSDRSGELLMLSRAPVPLATAENTELIVFRERHSNAEHVAIAVGAPDLSGPVNVRIHSSCFTGDILGSMKCDCGEQLQRAIVDMADGDGGVVLYLSQEGRGIGLASKLLAYQLQDRGIDTIDANKHLGFESDERQYSAAVSMLDKLGIRTIRLITNNPLKIQALRDQGISVESRIPSPATANVHNTRYLQTKRERAGHMACCEASV